VYELFCYFTSYLLNVNGCADILSHGHGISSVVVIQLTLALKQPYTGIFDMDVNLSINFYYA
jgi:hypothetical protein